MINYINLEINSFKLFYDGLYRMEFEYENKEYCVKPYIEPWMLFRILKNEGLLNVLEEENSQLIHGIECSKSTIIFTYAFMSYGILPEGFVCFGPSISAVDFEDPQFYLVDFIFKSDE